MATSNTSPRSPFEETHLNILAQIIADEGPHADMVWAAANNDLIDLCCRATRAVMNREMTRYAANLKLLHQEACAKLDRITAEKGSDRGGAEEDAGPDVLAGLNRLNVVVGQNPREEVYDGWLTRLFRHWQRFQKAGERRKYEALWEWVAERSFPSTV